MNGASGGSPPRDGDEMEWGGSRVPRFSGFCEGIGRLVERLEATTMVEHRFLFCLVGCCCTYVFLYSCMYVRTSGPLIVTCEGSEIGQPNEDRCSEFRVDSSPSLSLSTLAGEVGYFLGYTYQSTTPISLGLSRPARLKRSQKRKYRGKFLSRQFGECSSTDFPRKACRLGDSSLARFTGQTVHRGLGESIMYSTKTLG